MNATIRHYRVQDLGRVLRLWETRGPLSAGDGLTVDQVVDLVNSETTIALVAEEGAGDIVGLAVGESSAVVGWIHKLAVLPDAPDGDEIAETLLNQLEERLTDRGARKLAMLVEDDDASHEECDKRGYQAAPTKLYVERDVSAALAVPTAVAEIGGQMVQSGLWDRLAGMDQAKEIIERRVVLPLAQPELASRHAVDTPRAIMMFGPPGTGKTTFAKGLASLLDWVFVEIKPGELASEGQDRQAQRLGEMFDRVLELPTAVVFVDEVEEIASVRQTERKVGPSVTNEFLKQIPRLRQSVQHLLICATNAVGNLDPAVLRPGRFGYVIPVGPPDDEARRAIWQRFVQDITDQEIDFDALVAATERFTPADIEFVARKAAHAAFEREHFENVTHRATTEDFLSAISGAKPTVTEEMAEAFRRDADQYTRY